MIFGIPLNTAEDVAQLSSLVESQSATFIAMGFPTSAGLKSLRQAATVVMFSSPGISAEVRAQYSDLTLEQLTERQSTCTKVRSRVTPADVPEGEDAWIYTAKRLHKILTTDTSTDSTPTKSSSKTKKSESSSSGGSSGGSSSSGGVKPKSKTKTNYIIFNLDRCKVVDILQLVEEDSDCRTGVHAMGLLDGTPVLILTASQMKLSDTIKKTAQHVTSKPVDLQLDAATHFEKDEDSSSRWAHVFKSRGEEGDLQLLSGGDTSALYSDIQQHLHAMTTEDNEDDDSNGGGGGGSSSNSSGEKRSADSTDGDINTKRQKKSEEEGTSEPSCK